MPTTRSPHPALCISAVMIVLSLGCSGEDGNLTGVDNKASLNAYIESLPGWSQPSPYRRSVSSETKTITRVLEPIPDYRCDAEVWEWNSSRNEIFAPEQDFAVLWPGAVYKASDYHAGNLDPLTVPRSSVTIFSNLAGSQSIIVNNPTPTSMNDAINQMRGSVDPQAYQSEWDFHVEEIYNKKHAAMEVGVSIGYGSIVGGALDYSVERTVTNHVVFGRAMQKMYTIHFADGDKLTPADLFASSVTPQQLQDAGISDTNVPVYVKSVTYGQMVLFRAVVSSQESASKFKSDFKAAFKGFTGGSSGGSTGTDLLKSADYAAQGYGGDPGQSGDALAAVKDQTFGKFFDGATVQKAVPLFFEVMTVRRGADGNPEPANLQDWTTYETWENCKAATGYRVNVQFRRIKANKVMDRQYNYKANLACGPLSGQILEGTALTGLMNFPKADTWYDVDKNINCTLTTRADESFYLAVGTAIDLDPVFSSFTYPFEEWPRGVFFEICRNTDPGSPCNRPSITVKDGFLPSSPDRKVTFDLRWKLTATYD